MQNIIQNPVQLAKLDVPVKLLIDSAVAYSMDEIDMVFLGADGVVESGGIINMMGTYQIALVAKTMDKPVDVAAESYKFDYPVYEARGSLSPLEVCHYDLLPEKGWEVDLEGVN